MIGYLHPIRDGNGRTARALFYWYVLKRGYWLFEFMPISLVIKRAPARYSRAYIYTETDDNDINVLHCRTVCSHYVYAPRCVPCVRRHCEALVHRFIM